MTFRSTTSTKAMLVALSAVMGATALVLGVVTWSRVATSIQAVRHAHALKTTWNELMSLVKDAETGQRGFQITGAEEYLQPYDDALAALPGVIDRLVLLTGEDPAARRRLQAARASLEAKLDELKRSLTVRRREGREAASQLIQQGEGKRLMEELRREVLRVMQELEAQSQQRIADMQADLRWGYASSIVAGGVALGAGAVAFYLFMETLRQLRREERLALAKQRAEQADKEKSTFLATMSHEIRTPMNAILGFGELLEAEVRTEKERRYVQSILNGGRSLLQIINDILDLSKIEAGMLTVRAEATDPAELAQFVKLMFGPQAARKGLDLLVELQPDLPRCLMIDSVRMRQILLNLVGNALKFTEEGHVTIRVGGRREPDERNRWQLRIEIADTGIGIPTDEHADVFRPFVQTRARGAAEQPGTGLGLAIVKRLTQLMDGSVALRSAPGEGTTFTLEFPRVEMSSRLPLPAPVSDEGVDFNALQAAVIAVADDNEANRDLLRGIFDGSHHRLVVAADGREVVELIDREKPHVVLMDVRMPVMDGRQALEFLRQTPGLELLPIIAVTASSLAADEEALRRSFDGYVRKPFSRGELFRQLAQFIPRVDAARPGASRAVAAGHPPGVPTGDPSVILSQLRALEHGMWPRVREAMVMSDVRHFAATLAGLAKSASCAPLLAYSQQVESEALSFSLEALEESLAAYPHLVTQIEAHLSTAPALS